MSDNEIKFPTPVEVKKFIESSTALVEDFNSRDLLCQYAADCSAQIHDFCVSNAFNKKIGSINLLSSLPNPANLNIKSEIPGMTVATQENLHDSGTQNPQNNTLLTTSPLISLKSDWNNSHFLAGSYNHALHFTLDSFKPIEKPEQNSSIPIIPPNESNAFCRCACFHPSDALIGVSKDTSIYLYDISSIMKEETNPKPPFLLSTLKNLHKFQITGLVFSPDGSHFVTSSLDSTIKTNDLIQSKAVYDISIKNQITYLDASINGQFVGATTDIGELILFDDRQEGNILKISAHQSWASTLCFSKYNPFVATGGSDKSINVFDLREPTVPSQVFRLHRPFGTPYSITFDQIGNLWCGTSFGELYSFKLENAQNNFAMNINQDKSIAHTDIDEFVPIYSVLYVESNNSILYSTGNDELKMIPITEELFQSVPNETFANIVVNDL